MRKPVDPSSKLWIFSDSSVASNQNHGQCDCACAEPVLLRREIKPQAGHLYQLYPGFQSVRLDHEVTVGLGKNRPLLLNASALELVRRFNSPYPLTGVGWSRLETAAFDQMVLSGLLIPVGCDDLPPDSPETLTVWLHITDRCNLRCSYCYLPHHSENMTYQTSLAAVQAAVRSASLHAFPRIKLKYAGGEPLLQFELLTKLHTAATRLCEETGIHLDGVVLTNGTQLTRSRLDQMARLGLRCIVSLDGLGSGGARQRLTVGGRASTAAVLRGLELAQQAGSDVAVSVTVTNLNLGELVELVDWLVENKLDFGLNFHRPAGGLSTGLPDPFELVAVLRSVYQRLYAHPERLDGASLLDRASLLVPHQHPCAAGHSALVFDCTGRVAACPMLLGQPVTALDSPDPLGRLRLATGDRLNPPVEQIPSCQACEWRSWCAGGCPLLRHTPAHDRYCQVYRELFPDLLKLEGLRLWNKSGL